MVNKPSSENAEVNKQLNDESKIEVTYKFYLPEHKELQQIFSESNELLACLEEIYQKCRHVWKYRENVTEDFEAFAEEIAEIAIRFTGRLESR